MRLIYQSANVHVALVVHKFGHALIVVVEVVDERLGLVVKANTVIVHPLFVVFVQANVGSIVFVFVE